MPTIDDLQARGAALFTAGRRDGARRDRPAARFSWFDPDDATAAVGVAAQLVLVTAAAPTVEEGLERAVDLAESRADELGPDLVAQAMGIFVTHHRPARLLGRPRTVRARPELFAPSRPVGGAVPSGTGRTSTGPEAALDYWREDPFANEHHDHWHQVYPWPGMLRFSGDGLVWAESSDRAGLAALLGALDPTEDWPAFLATATPQEIVDRFLTLVQPVIPTFGAFTAGLSDAAYRVLFRLNDRQGELFLYMHSQMLARYDAERLSHLRERVVPFGPAAAGAPIPEGYSPGLAPFTDRAANEKLPQSDVDRLVQMQGPIDTAIATQRLLRTAGTPRAVDSDALGHALEASQAQLSGLSRQAYPGLHNQGHGMFGRLPNGQGNGVMNVPAVAIRDPVFWRWHKHIDDANVAWQATQPAMDFSDAPRVVVRDALAGAAAAWASPDVLLLSTAGLADGADPAALVTAAVGGAAFDTAVAAGPLPGAAGLVVVDGLTTRMVQSPLSDGQVVTHLTHDPFALVVRLRNLETRPTAVTLRVFLAPASLDDDRTAWMELDKLLVELPAGGRSVVYRPDTEFAVVKKPAETDPQSVLDGQNDPTDPNYCDCGWPYTLLLPRGTPDGMSFRLAVFCSDATRDLVGPSAECGSLSFCGAVDRYPDTRDMGYPFSRPFAASVADTVLGLPSAAGRSLSIRHEEGS